MVKLLTEKINSKFLKTKTAIIIKTSYNAAVKI